MKKVKTLALFSTIILVALSAIGVSPVLGPARAIEAELTVASQFPGGLEKEVYVPALYYEAAAPLSAGGPALVAIEKFPSDLAGECYCPPLYYEAHAVTMGTVTQR